MHLGDILEDKRRTGKDSEGQVEKAGDKTLHRTESSGIEGRISGTRVVREIRKGRPDFDTLLEEQISATDYSGTPASVLTVSHPNCS